MIALIICASNISHDICERECVRFYKEYNYVTKDCEKYSNKIKGIKQKKE